MIIIIVAVGLLFSSSFLFSGGEVPGNFGDLYKYVIPFRHFATETLQGGHLPLWNPYIFSGTPFLASPQSALFYPGTLFFYFFPMGYASSWFTTFHLILNSLGMFLLLRTLLKGRTASVLGALAWGYGFFFLSKLSAGHIIHLSGYSWFCFTLIFLLRRSTLNLGAMAGILMFMSGHLQVWMHSVVFIFLFWVFRSFLNPKNLKSTVNAIYPGCLLFLGLCMIQALPTLTYTFHSYRQMIPEIFGKQALYDFASSYSMKWDALIGLIHPNFFSTPMSNSFPSTSHPSTYFETYTLYFGLIPLGLALLGFWRLIHKKKFIIPGLALAFLLLALGKNMPLYDWIWRVFSSFRVPARFYFLFLFLMIISAAFFWNSKFKLKSPTFKLLILFIVIFDLYLNGKKMIWSEDPMIYLGRGKLLSQTANERNDSALPFRILSTGKIGNPNKSMLFRVLNVNGYEAIWQASAMQYFAWTQRPGAVTTTGLGTIDPTKNSLKLHSVKYLISDSANKHLISNFYPYFHAIYSNKTFSTKKEIFNLLDHPNIDLTKTLLTHPPQDETFEKQPGDIESVLTFRKNPNSILSILKGSKNSSFWALISEAFYPGWAVWRENGEKLKLIEANGYFMAVRYKNFKPPYGQLRFMFWPIDFRIGAWITILSLICLVFYGILVFRNRFKFEPHE